MSGITTKLTSHNSLVPLAGCYTFSLYLFNSGLVLDSIDVFFYLFIYLFIYFFFLCQKKCYRSAEHFCNSFFAQVIHVLKSLTNFTYHVLVSWDCLLA